MKNVLTILILSSAFTGLAQPNCQAYLYQGDSTRYLACKKAMEISGLYQFSKEYQQILDTAISIDPEFAYPYRAKSVAYLKSGDFLTWKKLIDKAVELDEIGYLGYRGWCRYQFFRDYAGAIEDIERLQGLGLENIGYSANGNYHLSIARALCYKALGDHEKALKIISSQVNKEDYPVGLYDYLHLAVLYLEMQQFSKAESALQRQLKHNPIADAYYYLAVLQKQSGQSQKALESLSQALEEYEEGNHLSDPYTTPIDRIFREDIDSAMAEISKS